jgi:hypothetical protein
LQAAAAGLESDSTRLAHEFIASEKMMSEFYRLADGHRGIPADRFNDDSSYKNYLTEVLIIMIGFLTSAFFLRK